MPRSGTSLIEQIIASHPDAKGAGELAFWSRAAHDHESVIRRTLFDESTRKKLAEDCLRHLEARSGDALRIVDKTPLNSDYLGVIHSVFPNARIIYMTERPVVTASAWQVRRKIYKNSVARWRNYEEFIGPLLELKDSA